MVSVCILVKPMHQNSLVQTVKKREGEMSPDPGDVRTVGCNLAKLVPDAVVLQDLRTAVERAQSATVQACLLLNVHVRRCLDEGLPLDRLFDGNWIVKAFYEVTEGDGSPRRDPELIRSAGTLSGIAPVSRRGMKQLLQANANVLATVARNNVWMHFRRRLLAHVRRKRSVSREELAALSLKERRLRSLDLLRAVDDLCAPPGKKATTASDSLREWVVQERSRLGIDEAVGEWKDKPLLYHLKTHTHRFLPVMRLLSLEAEAEGGRAMSLFPLRRSMVPKHVRFDKESLPAVLEALRNERSGRKRKRADDGDFTFANVIDVRAAKIKQRWRLKDGFTTDGVTARLQQVVDRGGGSSSSSSPTSCLPKRGLFAIDELKRVSRLEQWQVVGVDPGKRELVVAMDAEAPMASPVRYTQAQRMKETRAAQYRAEALRERTPDVAAAERRLADFRSKTADSAAFREYCEECLHSLTLRLEHYSGLSHRRRRWKKSIKKQQSEERLYGRLKGMQREADRPLVLAYGSWGTVAGRSGAACNKGNPPCIGVGLMRKLARRFVVAVTPEQYTSKTCCRCLGPCGPHPTMKTDRGKEIRGLRVCQNEDCKLFQNRDRAAALNIGLQFGRLFQGRGPLRKMTQEEKEMTMHRRCLECEG